MMIASRNMKILFTTMLKLYIFFIIFNGIRESLDIPSGLSFLITGLREILLYFLVVIALFFTKEIKTMGKSTVFFLMLVFAPVFISLIMGYDDFGNTFFYCYWLFRSFLFFIVMLNSGKYLAISDKEIFQYIIKLSLLLFIVTIIIYFRFNHLIIKKNDINQIGLGNQAIQSGIYVISLLICIHYKPFNKMVNVLFSLFLIVAIAGTVTSTAVFIVAIILFLCLFDPEKKKQVLAISFISAIIFTIIVIRYWDFFMEFISFFTKKSEELLQLLVKTLTFSSDQTMSASFGAREKQITKFFDKLTPDHMLFGMGEFAIIDKNMIENLYIAVFHDYGIAGLLFLGFSILKAVIIALKTFFKKKCVFQLSAIIIFILYGMTLYSILPFNMVGMFILLFYFAYWKEQKKYV